MKLSLRSVVKSGLTAVALTLSSSVLAQTVICYNCPIEWADWGSQIQAIKSETGITVPPDNKNSGQSLAQLVAEKNSPVADVVYLGVTSGIQGAKEELVEPFKPERWDDIPEGLKDKDGKWFSIHSGTLGFMVNVDALGGKAVPQSWEDLLKPDYKGMVAYLDPSSAFVGYAGAVAANLAMGGDLDNMAPGIAFLKKLKANDPIVPKQTSYARVLSGEIPILIDYDFNAYRAKYKDEANVEFVIPKEGTIVVPYVMSLVKGAPHAEDAKKVLNFVLSDKGQAIWANAYLRPVRSATIPAEVSERFLPETEYQRAQAVDYKKMAENQKTFAERYLKEVN
ncbi:ABC transporter substrate-binding protein [Oligella sp. HMSC09E12]|uniref:ABC transporter substrate-binding protein n=1 Tax=Oligella TaxID=90243 RepID=UPI0008A2E9A9|nr:ABC transporter substrate-binding protein [Oligella sp. HMSC09E12]SUA56190.1 2-aminoethylphosphonate ABC transporter substrate-binding protein [Oligella urethralis]